MPRFAPFNALRYAPGRVDMAAVLSPPYGSIDRRRRAELAASDPYNAVALDLPEASGGQSRYEVARCLLRDWLAAGVLERDDHPTFTVYRMAFTDESGTERHTTGVFGALELSPPAPGGILPHERTVRKPRLDRLAMLRHCQANTSAVWGLSPAAGLTGLLDVPGPPRFDVVDDDGVRHTAWVLDEPDRCAQVAAAVADAPVIIADGHHRYETALAFRDERAAASGSQGPGSAGAILTFVSELVEHELTVRPIHRLVSDLPAGVDVTATFAYRFELSDVEAGAPDTDATDADDARPDEGTPALLPILLLPDRQLLLKPRPDAFAADVWDDPGGQGGDLPDTIAVDTALADLPDHHVHYEPSAAAVAAAVATGHAQAGVLVRAVTAAQIDRAAQSERPLPAKTTFLAPKPKTGVVFRTLDTLD